MAANVPCEVVFNNAFVSNVVASTKSPGRCYVDIVGAFGQANFRTSAGNMAVLQAIAASGQPQTLRVNMKWSRFGKDTVVEALTIEALQRK